MPRKRPTKTTPKTADKLLAELAQGYSVSAACRAQGIDRHTYYDWYNADPEFRALADEALNAGTDRLEDAALNRALLESDTLTIFLLKSRRPDIYREPKQVIEHVGKDETPLKVVFERVTRAD